MGTGHACPSHACPVGWSFAAHVAGSQVDNLWSDIQLFLVSYVKTCTTFTTFHPQGLKNTKLVDPLSNSLNLQGEYSPAPPVLSSSLGSLGQLLDESGVTLEDFSGAKQWQHGTCSK